MQPVARPDRLEDPFGLVGQVLSGKFRVDSVVARGGFGTMYRGTHLTLSRPIAIKVLRTPERVHSSVRDAVRTSFEREAQMIAKLSHPAVVNVIEFGVEPADDMPLLWMVLEWIEGRPLSTVLRERNGQRFSPAEALDLLRPVLQALVYAHEQGVAHRDLKPGNIMVCATRHGPGVKLIDFGIAKSMDEGEAVGDSETRTQSAFAVYSPRYAAPEQVGRARTGPWTDVHALGLILTEMLVGHPAYAAPTNDLTQLIAEVMNPQRPTPGRMGIDVGAWEGVIARALALRATERFTHAGELLDALERTLQGAGIPRGTEVPGATSGIVASGTTSGMTGGAHFAVAQPATRASTRSIALVVLGVALLVVCGVSVGAWLSRQTHPAVATPTPQPVAPPLPTPVVPAVMPMATPTPVLPVAMPTVAPTPVLAPATPMATPTPVLAPAMPTQAIAPPAPAIPPPSVPAVTPPTAPHRPPATTTTSTNTTSTPRRPTTPTTTPNRPRQSALPVID